MLIGIAKLVAGPDTADRRLTLAIETLELVVSRICQDLHVAALTEEVGALRQRVAALQQVRGRTHPEPDDGFSGGSVRKRQPVVQETGSLVGEALAYLDQHYLDPGLSLAGISRALRVNDKYLTRLFTRTVGKHMHSYIQNLRVQHACQLLLSTDKPIKEVAYESGFRRPGQFRRAFRGHLGVSSTIYRRIFVAS